MKPGPPALAALALLLSVGLRAGPPSAEPAVSHDVPALDPIRLDTIVTDAKARPIRDLTVADFQIIDAGETVPLESAVLQTGGDGRLVAIFLDEYHTQQGESTARARAAVTQFVDSALQANDLVAIMKPLDPLKTIQVTRNRELLHAAIDSFTGRKGDYAPRTPFEETFMSRAPATADASRAQVVSSALQTLALRIGAMRDGRKSIVLVSEGFVPALPRGSDRLMGSLRAVVYTANRYGVSIYSIDPRVPSSPTDAPGTADPSISALRALADETGGHATINEADLTSGLAQSVSDLDDYYMLTYHTAGVGDGKFHPVQVRVTRPGAHVRTRSGYWAANAALLNSFNSTNSVLGSTRVLAMPVRPPHSSPLIRPWIGTARGPDGFTSVVVTWEPGQAPPRNQSLGAVILKATTRDGHVLFQDRVDSRATFDAAPGPIQLEITIESEDGKTLDSDYRGMEVPNLAVARPTFATAQVVRTRNAREFALAAANRNLVPVSSREFSRAERLLVRVPIYGPGDATPAVTATLMNRVGASMRVLAAVPGDLPTGLVQFDLPLSSLAPDEYRVEFVATSGSQEGRALLLFRVTN
jgi:VWFA-related protein